MMEIITLKSNIGAGSIELGMSRSQVHLLMGEPEQTTDRNIITDDYYDSLFRVSYDLNKTVNFIEIISGIKRTVKVLYENQDVFNTKSNDLVRFLGAIEPYKPDMESMSGYCYIFENLGISLWRPVVFDESMLLEQWFQEMPKENKVDEMRHLYFETLAIFRNGYYD